MSSCSMVFSRRKGLKILQSGNWRALGCPKSGPVLHSCRGTDSATAGASAERDTELSMFMSFEFGDAKDGDASETGLCDGTVACSGMGRALDGRGGSSDALSGQEPSPARLSLSA